MGFARVRVAHGVAQVDVSPQSLDGFPADYSDAFRVATVPGSTASAWARSSLRGADVAKGAFRHVVWHGALGFELAAAGTPDTLVGWRIASDLPERFVLDANGRLMRGRMIFEVSPPFVTWTTMLMFHRPAGARVWSVAAHVHRALARQLLGRAASSLRR